MGDLYGRLFVTQHESFNINKKPPDYNHTLYQEVYLGIFSK